MGNHTKEELEFLKRIGIDLNKLKYRWEWVDEEKALLFYRDVIYPHFNRVPKIIDINLLFFPLIINLAP
ncbi:hypothetical protein LCGC14_2220620 [marine sediment metagenome]|uniref:Uncharacterized protein n=1 Tax=marine sediment metagenome TaxID=412755 RepID=A0A0F9DYN0_9ZZZZ